ncbi:MAG: hypothetical protein WCT05_06560, partial [Lentisphaeria bacterium]
FLFWVLPAWNLIPLPSRPVTINWNCVNFFHGESKVPSKAICIIPVDTTHFIEQITDHGRTLIS